MTRPPTPSHIPVASAAVEALLAARWECAELLSRRPPQLAADLLRGHAAELATSALASDQVLSLTLETAACDIEAGAPPLDGGALFLFTDAGCAADERTTLRDRVLQLPGEPAPTPAELVNEFERRLADRRLTTADLSRRLAAEARLQEALWDDPRLPAQMAVRLAMLRSIPRLAERAAELDRRQSRACRNVTAQASRPRWTPVARRIPAHAPAQPFRWRWSSQHTGWLLIVGLLVVALVLAAPLGSAPAD